MYNTLFKRKIMNWYVLYTKPRCEKKAEEQLLSIGINAYCPKRKEIRFWSDRKRSVYVPLLPSMILVKIDEKNINKVFNSPCVTRYMFWLGKRATVKQIEVETLKKYFNGNFNISDSEISNIKVGDNFALSSFNNQKGIVERISNNNIWIFLNSLGYTVKLKLA